MTSPYLVRFAFSLFCCCAVLSGLLALTGCGDAPEMVERPDIDSSDTRSKNLVQLLAQHDSLGRFEQLLDETALQEQLETFGPWTVFAPIDPAFQRARYRLDTLFRPSNLDSLRMLLRYHVVRGRIDTSEVNRERGDSLRLSTLYEEPLTVYRRGERYTVNGAGVLGLIPAQNGVVYVIDTVLELPPPDTTVQEDILFF